MLHDVGANPDNARPLIGEPLGTTTAPPVSFAAPCLPFLLPFACFPSPLLPLCFEPSCWLPPLPEEPGLPPWPPCFGGLGVVVGAGATGVGVTVTPVVVGGGVVAAGGGGVSPVVVVVVAGSAADAIWAIVTAIAPVARAIRRRLNLAPR